MDCSAMHFVALHCALALKQHTYTLPGSRLLVKPCTKASATWEESLTFQNKTRYGIHSGAGKLLISQAPTCRCLRSIPLSIGVQAYQTELHDVHDLLMVDKLV